MIEGGKDIYFTYEWKERMKCLSTETSPVGGAQRGPQMSFWTVIGNKIYLEESPYSTPHCESCIDK